MLEKNLYTLYASEFNKTDGNARIIPPTVEIDLTNSCNQDCVYCCSDEHRKTNPSKAKFDNFIRLIDELAQWSLTTSTGGIKSIVFVGGGEPTLFKNYELLIKHSLDRGFLTSLVTNGTQLDKLLSIGSEYIKRMSWIGVDVDSANTEIYNLVRMPKTNGQFEQVKQNIKLIVEAGGIVDIKALILDSTANKQNIIQLFEYTTAVNARMLYLRSAVLEKGNGNAYIIEEHLLKYINDLKKIYNIQVRAKQRDSIKTRCYKKCYALYLLPIFSADGIIYLCPEHRGNKELALCNWITDDWQSLWCDVKHNDIFNTFDISNCMPCRPDPYNVGIQQVINKPESFEELFF